MKMLQDNFHIVLVEPKYGGNIGSVARAMANFGFKNLAMVKPPKIGLEGRKSAMHARELMEGARVFKTFKDVVGAYDFLVGTTAKIAGDSNKLRTPVLVEELSKSLDTKGRIALVFGREDHGLLNEELELCDALITIPTHQGYPTLNLAQSVGVVLYELSKVENKKIYERRKKFRLLSKVEKDVLFRFYDDLVDEIYEMKFENGLAKRTFKTLVGRAFMSGREAKTLTGLFRKSAERLKRRKQ